MAEHTHNTYSPLTAPYTDHSTHPAPRIAMVLREIAARLFTSCGRDAVVEHTVAGIDNHKNAINP